MPKRQTRIIASRLLAAAAAAILFIGLGLAGLVLSQSSLQMRTADEAAVEPEFDAVRHRFGDKPAYVVVVRDAPPVTLVRHELEPREPRQIEAVKGIAWDPATGRRVVVSTPYWVFRATRWKARALGSIVRPFHEQIGLDLELPDLAPLGPGLVLDERYPNGRRIIVWTE